MVELEHENMERFDQQGGFLLERHDAVDLPALPGEEIIACEKGTVLYRIEGFLGNTSAIYKKSEVQVLLVYMGRLIYLI